MFKRLAMKKLTFQVGLNQEEWKELELSKAKDELSRQNKPQPIVGL